MRADFTRVTWTSGAAQRAWQQRIQQASQAWLNLEVESVNAGIRDNALVFGSSRPNRESVRVEVAPNRYAIGIDGHRLAHAFRDGDDETIGRLLGFPECCRSFFTRTWGAGLLDTTWEMANPNYSRGDEHGDAHYDSIAPETLRQVDGPIECNILGRWLGIRWVQHLPCSFNCEETAVIGRRMRDLMRRVNPAATDTIDEVLSWPIEWSALHGVAEVKYPVCKVSTRTTATREKRIVRRDGPGWPAEGARGLVFPYRRAAADPAAVHAATLTFRDNGFSSEAAMHAAHDMVLAALPSWGVESVIDLGSGNGLLLERVAQRLGITNVLGFEAQADKQRRARVETIAGQIANLDVLLDRRFSLALISQRRFEEMTAEQRTQFAAWSASHLKRLLVYSYDDPMFAEIREVIDGSVSTHRGAGEAGVPRHVPARPRVIA